MRNIALAALAAVLPAVAGQAQTVDICDRTQQVRDAILRAVDAADCAAVDSDGLAGVNTLDLRSKQLTALRAEDWRRGCAHCRQVPTVHRSTPAPASATKADWARAVQQLADEHFPGKRIVLMDNLNTHAPRSLYGVRAGRGATHRQAAGDPLHAQAR